MARNHKLDDAQKTFVVQQLACFEAARTVADALKSEWGVVVTPQAVECYNPTTRAGSRLARRWRDLFAETRAAYLADTAAVGVAHKRVRLTRLDRMAERAERMGNMALAAELLAQAAREVGGAFERRGLSVAADAGGDDDGGDGVTVNVVIRQLTPPPGAGGD